MYAADAELLEALSKQAPDSEAGGKTEKIIQKWRDTEKKYDGDAEKLQEDAEKLEHRGHMAHGSSNFFDLGELGIEIALVLCSVALLAKRHVFWLTGIAVGRSVSSWRWAASSWKNCNPFFTRWLGVSRNPRLRVGLTRPG